MLIILFQLFPYSILQNSSVLGERNKKSAGSMPPLDLFLFKEKIFG
jgi:hypothetical protein